MKRSNIANFITFLRIVFAVALISSIEELLLTVQSSELDRDCKSIISYHKTK